jgi:hypothetical protein
MQSGFAARRGPRFEQDPTDRSPEISVLTIVVITSKIDSGDKNPRTRQKRPSRLS